MKAETKIYSDFIKANKIKVSRDYFIYKGEEIMISKDDDGMWYAENEDKSYSKKASIYFYIKNRM